MLMCLLTTAPHNHQVTILKINAKTRPCTTRLGCQPEDTRLTPAHSKDGSSCNQLPLVIRMRPDGVLPTIVPVHQASLIPQTSQLFAALGHQCTQLLLHSKDLWSARISEGSCFRYLTREGIICSKCLLESVEGDLLAIYARASKFWRMLLPQSIKAFGV